MDAKQHSTTALNAAAHTPACAAPRGSERTALQLPPLRLPRCLLLRCRRLLRRLLLPRRVAGAWSSLHYSFGELLTSHPQQPEFQGPMQGTLGGIDDPHRTFSGLAHSTGPPPRRLGLPQLLLRCQCRSKRTAIWHDIRNTDAPLGPLLSSSAGLLHAAQLLLRA